jgi:glycosyltransferase involved in cell wall biosynthesis
MIPDNMDERKQHCGDQQEATLPSASLLICSRNRAQLLSETIQSILAGYKVPAEIIVIDQSDIPNALLSSFQPDRPCTFRYIWSEKKGVSLGRNMAISMSSHQIIIITDDDMLATLSWLETIVKTLVASGERSVITGRVGISGTEGGFAPSIQENKHLITYEGRVGRDVLYTGNMAAYRSAFEEVGYFDERLGPGTEYPAAEDNDLCFRLLEAKYRIIYEPNALLFHRAWRSGKEFLSLHWNYGLGQGAFYAKYFGLRDAHMIRRMVTNVVAYVIRIPFRIFRDRSQAQKDIHYVGGLLYGVLRWSLSSSKMNLERGD